MTAAVPSRGMQLGKKTKQADFVQALQADVAPQEASPLLASASSPSVAAPPSHYPTAASSSSSMAGPSGGSDVVISIEEQIAMVAHRDGGLKSLEVKGELNVVVHQPQCNRIKIQTQLDSMEDIQFKVLFSACSMEEKKAGDSTTRV